MTEKLNQAVFADNLNTTFLLNLEGLGPIELQLSKVSDINRSYGTEAFSIVFRGPGKAALSQRTYELQHETMGKFDIMLVPIGHDEQGVEYEAVFNRLIEETNR